MTRRTSTCLAAALGAGLAALPRPADNAAMSERDELVSALKARGAAFEEMPAADGKLLIVPALGARIVGAFFDGENVLWVPPGIGKAGDWNGGGARTWLGPEGHEKGFFFDQTWAGERWKVQPALDPGSYRPVAARRAGAKAWASEMKLTTNDRTAYHLEVTREIGPAADDAVPAAPGLRRIGVRVTQRLKNVGSATADRTVGLWSLVMVKPGGTMIVPVNASAPGYLYRDTYFERVPPGLITDNGGALTMKVAGPPRYKIGISPARCRGLTGSVAALPGGTWQLIVKRFPCDPNGIYTDRPRDAADTNGDAIQGYNHLQGGAEGFYELECHAPAVVLAPGREQEHAVDLAIYRGPEAAVKAMGTRLLGVPVERLKLY